MHVRTTLLVLKTAPSCCTAALYAHTPHLHRGLEVLAEECVEDLESLLEVLGAL